jgi:hypothetical protein
LLPWLPVLLLTQPPAYPTQSTWPAHSTAQHAAQCRVSTKGLARSHPMTTRPQPLLHHHSAGLSCMFDAVSACADGWLVCLRLTPPPCTALTFASKPSQAGWNVLMGLLATSTALLNLKPLPKASCHTRCPACRPAMLSMYASSYLQQQQHTTGHAQSAQPVNAPSPPAHHSNTCMCCPLPNMRSLADCCCRL